MGQGARVSGDLAGERWRGLDQPLDGVVRWVSSDNAFTPYFALTEDDRGRLGYPAKIDLVGADRRIPDGVPVEVELLLDGAGP